MKILDILYNIKSELFDAPSDIKLAFNNLVSYFAGKCPESGCTEQDKEGNWRIISNHTGEYWKQKYKSKESAENALKAYHANRHFDDKDSKSKLSKTKNTALINQIKSLIKQYKKLNRPYTSEDIKKRYPKATNQDIIAACDELAKSE